MTNPEENVHETTAVIDNGSFGTRTIRFETGRLARQAAGSVVAYLDDDTMLLSATTASKQPKEHFDFFPLTVDVEERMYAIGKIPGSFFRREGRPGTDAILTCRLIDRPLRPSFVDGLRNEIQIVVTVLSLDPQDPYDALAINAASASTQLVGPAVQRPDRRRARRPHRGRSGSRSRQYEDLQRAVFDMVVAGRVVGERRRDHDGGGRGHHRDHRAGRGRRAGAHRGRRRAGPGGGEAVHPQPVRGPAAAGRRRRQADRRVPDLPGLPARRASTRSPRRRPTTSRRADDRRQAGARVAHRRGQGRGAGEGRAAVRGPREGDRRRVPVAEQEARPPPDPHRPGPHRRSWHHRHPAAVGRGRGRPAGARLGAVRARRDPDHGRHHAEHAAHGAADRLARPGDAQALPAPLQLPALLHR